MAMKRPRTTTTTTKRRMRRARDLRSWWGMTSL